MRLVLQTEGIPIAKARIRAMVRGKHAHVYDPQLKLLQHFKWQLQQESQKIGLERPLALPITVCLTFGMPYPKSMSKKKRIAALPITKPDIDNLAITVLNCGNGILWEDDRIIVSLQAKKLYADKPFTLIQVTPFLLEQK